MSEILATHAMLSHLTIKDWSGRAQDKDVAHFIEQSYGSQPGVGVYRKELMSKEFLAEIKAIGRAARQVHYTLTLPWDDKGTRLLPVKVYDRYKTSMDSFSNQRERAFRNLMNEYDKGIEDAKARLGSLFRTKDYPDKADLTGLFEFDVNITPVPDSRHFVADLPEQELERVRQQMEARIEGQMHSAVNNLYARISEMVTDCAEKLSDPDEGDKAHVLHASMLDRLNDLVELIPQLNITGDVALSQTCDRLVAVLDGLTVDKLRPKSKTYDHNKRTAMQETMSELADQFAGFFPSGDLPELATGGPDAC